MSFVRYEEAPVTVGWGTADQVLLATNVTVGENMPLTPVRALGYNGAIAVMPSGPPEGSFSISYNTDCGPNRERCAADSSGSTCSTAVPGNDAPFVDPSDTTFALKQPFTTSTLMWLSVGDIPSEPLFKKGFATSFSMSAEPNSVVSFTLNGSFFDCGILQEHIHEATPKDGCGELGLPHGSKSFVDAATISSAGFQCNPFSVSYEASRGTNPVYTLSSLEPAFVQVTDPQESMTLQGENLPYGTVGTDCDPCTTQRRFTFNLLGLCSSAGSEASSCATYSVCGPVTSRDIEVAVDDVLRGNITVVDYNFQQTMGTIDACT